MKYFIFSAAIFVCTSLTVSHGLENFDYDYNSPNVTNTTTVAPTTKVTTATTKATTTNIITMKPIGPPTGTPVFRVKKEGTNSTCLMLQANITAKFPVSKNKITVTVPWNAETIGSCGNVSDRLSLDWSVDNGSSEYRLEMTFNKGSDDYSLSSIGFHYIMIDNVTGDFQSNTTQFTSDIGTYYKCAAGADITIKDLTLTFGDLQVSAFMNDTSADPGFGAKGKTCPPSPKSKTDAIVPIAVGAALAAMVLIVLVGYCIGRRRQSAGYQSMNA